MKCAVSYYLDKLNLGVDYALIAVTMCFRLIERDKQMTNRITPDESLGWISCKVSTPKSNDDSVIVYWPENGSRETVHIQDFFDDITDGIDDLGEQMYTQWYLSAGVTHWHAIPEFKITEINR